MNGEKETNNLDNKEDEEEKTPRQRLLDDLSNLIFYYYNEVDGIGMVDLIASLDMVKLHLFVKHNNSIIDWSRFDESIEAGMIQ